MQGLRDRAEVVSNRLLDDLRALTGSRLGRIRKAFVSQDDTALAEIVARDAWIELAFAYDRWALVTWPASTVSRPERSSEAFAPPGFGLAEQLEFVDRNLEEAIALYRRCTSEATPVYWQLRAEMAIAGCRTKQGRYAEAIEIYERLRRRYAMLLRGLDNPSLFSVELALVDVLDASGQPDQAARAVERLLELVLAGQVPLPAREYAELLLHRLKRYTKHSPDQLREVERQLAEIADRQHQLAGAASVVRTWMEPRLRPSVSTENRGVQFVTDTLAGVPRCLAYVRFDRNGVETLVGLCIRLPALFESFVQPRVRADADGDLVVLPKGRSDQVADAPWTEALDMPLQDWQLQPADAFLGRVDRQVSRQTWTYISLTVVTVVVLFAALGLLGLGVHREMALTRLKNEFVANVSHELKTPLALIRLFGETLLYGRAAGEDKRREYYAVITRESERLTHLINNILDFSRIDAGHKEYDRSACDVGEVVGQTLESYRFQLDHHEFDCRVEIDDDLPVVRADADAIEQAVLNLLNNAVKYSQEDKRIEVCVRKAQRRERNGVTICVRDHGVGIPREERDRLFEGFFRGSDETIRAVRGSGLGLTLVHHIVTGHDGDIWVESEPGEGSAFTMFLPAANHTASGETSCHKS